MELETEIEQPLWVSECECECEGELPENAKWFKQAHAIHIFSSVFCALGANVLCLCPTHIYLLIRSELRASAQDHVCKEREIKQLSDTSTVQATVLIHSYSPDALRWYHYHCAITTVWYSTVKIESSAIAQCGQWAKREYWYTIQKFKNKRSCLHPHSVALEWRRRVNQY